MTFKEFIKKYGWLVIPVVLIVVAWFSGDYYGQRLVRDSLESKADTVTKVVTVYKDFPQPQQTAKIGYIAVPMYKFLSDTVTAIETAYLHDTTVVYLPREEKYYEEEDGRLRLWVSGYEPRLDRYELDNITTTITNTIVEHPSRWSISISAGYAATLHSKTVVAGPYIGIGISYSLIRF